MEVELWSLSNSNVKEFCVAWRKSLRRVWGLPFHTHGVLLTTLSQCLPVFDKTCRRSLNFVQSCIRHKSALKTFNLLVCTDCTLVVVHFLDGMWYFVLSGSTVH